MTFLAAQSPGTTAPARGAPLSDLITLTIVFAVAGLLLLAVSVGHRKKRVPWLRQVVNEFFLRTLMHPETARQVRRRATGR